MPTRVLLADDHHLVRESVRLLLERHGFEIVADVADGNQAVEVAAKLHPEVAVLDLAMPHLNGIDCAREMLKVSPRTKVLLLTMHREGQYVVQALRAGIRGFVLKTQLGQDLVRAIEEVLRGAISVSPELSPAFLDASLGKARPADESLTPRERRVLQLVSEGKTTKEVASDLGLSVRTAESHRARLMQKLNIHDIAGLVRYAIRHGFIEP